MKHIPADPADRVGYLLWQTAHLVARQMQAALEPFELTLAQFGALVHTGREPGVSAAELARRIDLTPQSVHTALRPLLERGWLQRRAHPVHGRVLGNYLTAEGTARTRQAGDAVAEADDRLLHALDAQEATQLKDLLGRVRVILNPLALDRSSIRAENLHG